MDRIGIAVQRFLTGGRSAQEVVEESLQKILDPQGEGPRAFISSNSEASRLTARWLDACRESLPMGALAGVTVSIKDLFDVAGEKTTAGSVEIAARSAPAVKDSVLVARLRAAGAILMGRTNMTECAYSGIGINPHYGTPSNAFERSAQRIPGGSTSGGAISVADGMVHAALGSDTGGSIRIPAALNGLVGYKPTADRYSLQGVLALSRSLDSAGVISQSMDCIRHVDRVLASVSTPHPEISSINDLRLGVLTNLVCDGLDQHVAENYARSLSALSAAGAVLTDLHSQAVQDAVGCEGQPTMVSSEAFSEFGLLVSQPQHRMDVRVAARIGRGRDVTATKLIQVQRIRASCRSQFLRESAMLDAWVMPTVPLVAPRIADLASDDEFFRVNALMLRNPGTFNFLDGCAVSIPNHDPGSAPTGFMIVGPAGNDEKLLAIAQALEPVLRRDASLRA